MSRYAGKVREDRITRAVGRRNKRRFFESEGKKRSHVRHSIVHSGTCTRRAFQPNKRILADSFFASENCLRRRLVVSRFFCFVISTKKYSHGVSTALPPSHGFAELFSYVGFPRSPTVFPSNHGKPWLARDHGFPWCHGFPCSTSVIPARGVGKPS